MTEKEVMQLLKAAIEKSGNVNKWAEENGFSSPFIYDVIKGRRTLSDRVVAALGLAVDDAAFDQSLDRGGFEHPQCLGIVGVENGGGFGFAHCALSACGNVSSASTVRSHQTPFPSMTATYKPSGTTMRSIDGP